MTLAARAPAVATDGARRDERRAIGVGGGAHALHDGYTDLVYIMLPIWQAEFGLGYAAVGLLRGFFAGTMAGLQIPAGMLAGRLGAPAVLAAGTALAGIGYCLAGLSASFPMLIAALIVGGIGASTQHPLASAVIARAYAGPRSLRALGTYNFAGDLGKMTVPALAALMLTVMAWRPTVAILGAIGVAAAAAVFWFMPRFADAMPAARPQDAAAAEPERMVRRGFPVLLTIGVLDSATRMGLLTFLPFILTAKGASLPTIGLALTLVFAGGAAGKLVCAYIGDRLGIIATVCLTEGLTALGIVALIPLPLAACLVVLPVLGVALNGTSSVLYGSVPALVAPTERTRAFSFFYTGTIGAGALAPVLYGFIGDRIGVTGAVVVVAAIIMLALPLALMLRPAFARIGEAA